MKKLTQSIHEMSPCLSWSNSGTVFRGALHLAEHTNSARRPDVPCLAIPACHATMYFEDTYAFVCARTSPSNAQLRHTVECCNPAPQKRDVVAPRCSYMTCNDLPQANLR